VSTSKNFLEGLRPTNTPQKSTITVSLGLSFPGPHFSVGESGVITDKKVEGLSLHGNLVADMFVVVGWRPTTLANDLNVIVPVIEILPTTTPKCRLATR